MALSIEEMRREAVEFIPAREVMCGYSCGCNSYTNTGSFDGNGNGNDSWGFNGNFDGNGDGNTINIVL